MNELMIFNNPEFGEIRTVVKGGEPFFVAADVCRALELGNSSQALSRLDEDEKGVISNDTPGGTQEMLAVNEPGLYTLVLGSRKKEAKAFKRWVVHEVLPSIRKTGEYVTPKKAQQRLGEVNSAARIIRQTLKEAGMAPQFVAVAMKSLYAPVGVEIPLIGITVDKQTYDASTIAKKLGIFSKNGNPHGQAVSAIISQVPVDASEKELVPFQNQTSGHSGENVQYAQSVIDKVSDWLARNGYPQEIQYGGKSYKVQYRENAA